MYSVLMPEVKCYVLGCTSQLHRSLSCLQQVVLETSPIRMTRYPGVLCDVCFGLTDLENCHRRSPQPHEITSKPFPMEARRNDHGLIQIRNPPLFSACLSGPCVARLAFSSYLPNARITCVHHRTPFYSLNNYIVKICPRNSSFIQRTITVQWRCAGIGETVKNRV